MEKKYHGIAYAAVGILGAVWHFIYDWTGGFFLVGLVCPVSESIWEHSKLVFVPFLLVECLVAGVWRKQPWPKIVRALCPAQLIGILFMSMGYYFIHGGLGFTGLAPDIVLFFVTAAVMQLVFAHALKHSNVVRWDARSYAAAGVLAALAIFYFLATFVQIPLPMFISPV